METIKEKVDKKVKELDNKIKPWLLIFGTLLIVMPFLLTQSWLGWIDFSSTGQIGDTIGGTLAPIVGLVGAVLVYISFREQYKANISQWEALEDEKTQRKLDDQIKERSDNFNLIFKLIEDCDTEIQDGIKIIKEQKDFMKITDNSPRYVYVFEGVCVSITRMKFICDMLEMYVVNNMLAKHPVYLLVLKLQRMDAAINRVRVLMPDEYISKEDTIVLEKNNKTINELLAKFK